MIKIGELSEITGVSVQTIRFYEKENLIKPTEVDRWTNYRYYNDESVVRLAEISYLKKLGFSLNEIKNFNENIIKEKIRQSKLDIENLTKNIKKLSTIKKYQGEIIMRTFINDNEIIGKWEKIGVVKNISDYKENIFSDNKVFDFNELYFLPNGEEYWVFSWTKGTLFVKNYQMPYKIIDGILFIGIRDIKTGKIDDYAVYKQIDNKKYKSNEIEIIDKTEFEFISDEETIGFWETIDFIDNLSNFKKDKQSWKGNFYLKKYAFEPQGNLIASMEKDKISQLSWTKNIIIDKNHNTASEYQIKQIDNEKYMFVEWKSGDYRFGGKINGYYVLKKTY